MVCGTFSGSRDGEASSAFAATSSARNALAVTIRTAPFSAVFFGVRVKASDRQSMALMTNRVAPVGEQPPLVQSSRSIGKP